MGNCASPPPSRAAAAPGLPLDGAYDAPALSIAQPTASWSPTDASKLAALVAGQATALAALQAVVAQAGAAGSWATAACSTPGLLVGVARHACPGSPLAVPALRALAALSRHPDCAACMCAAPGLLPACAAWARVVSGDVVGDSPVPIGDADAAAELAVTVLRDLAGTGRAVADTPGAVDALLARAKGAPTSPTHLLAMRALSNLAGAPGLAPDLASRTDVVPVCVAWARYSDSWAVVDCALDTVHGLSTSAACRALLVAAPDLLAAVVDAQDKPDAPPHTRLLAALTLQNLSMSSESAQALLNARFVMDACVARAGDADDAVAVAALDTLRNVTESAPRARQALVELPGLLDACDRFKPLHTSDAVAAASLRVLGSLVADQTVAGELVDRPGFVPVCAYRALPASSPDVRRAAVVVLARIAQAPLAAHAVAAQEPARALCEATYDESTRALALGALRCVVRFALEDGAQRPLALRMPEVAIRLMLMLGSSDPDARMTAAVLMPYMASSEKLCKLAWTDAALESVVQALVGASPKGAAAQPDVSAFHVGEVLDALSALARVDRAHAYLARSTALRHALGAVMSSGDGESAALAADVLQRLGGPPEKSPELGAGEGRVGAGSAQVVQGAPGGTTARALVSYAAGDVENRKLGARVVEALRVSGVQDMRGAQHGVVQVIKSCDVLVVVATRAYSSTMRCQAEVEVARRFNRRVVALVADPTFELAGSWLGEELARAGAPRYDAGGGERLDVAVRELVDGERLLVPGAGGAST